ncbi:MAG TPA: hypothetical protein VJ347_16350, partial [Streptosporangiaceae bacterium]|nr:hypothetical protein [Streptosporangiaceae bacterium]
PFRLLRRPGTKGGWGYPGRPARSPRRKKTSTRPTAAWLVSMLICPGLTRLAGLAAAGNRRHA